jgi:hypothetical protein
MIGLDNSILYAINGLTMTAAFFLIRIVYYTWIVIFKILIQKLFVQEFWDSYPEDQKGFMILSLTAYIGMALLQFVWFNKMVRGCLKALKKTFGDK